MKKIIYGSVCSGVEAATVAWHPLGWEPAWFCEFDKFPSAVLSHHYPEVPNLNDMTKIEERKEYHERPINLLVGGTPCQSFSVAGLRKGLDDDRGNLALEFCGILREKQPRWFVWENVPGVLSSNGGRDFAAILSGFRECGYGFAYRVLDAQYFGVAQRRRRVFVVGHIRDWRPAAAVLFERDSVRGYSAPRRETGEDASENAGKSVAGSHWDGEAHPSLAQSSHNSGGIGQSNQEIFSQRGAGLVGHRMTAFGEYVEDDTASTLKQRDYKDATDLVAIHGTQDPDILKNQAHTLGRNTGQENAICFAQNSRDEVREMPYAGALSAQPGAKQQSYIKNGMAVRRLTPIECERLQGFPDNYTRIAWRGRQASECPDGPRYKAMGNSMAVPVMRWIGERIQMFENIK